MSIALAKSSKKLIIAMRMLNIANISFKTLALLRMG